jgi:hypothetical protein
MVGGGISITARKREWLSPVFDTSRDSRFEFYFPKGHRRRSLLAITAKMEEYFHQPNGDSLTVFFA